MLVAVKLTVRLLCLALVAAAAAPSAAFGQVSMGPISSDGTHVIFRTDAALVAADTDNLNDVYERFAGQTRLVSAPGAGASGPPQISNSNFFSDDGGTVIFTTAESLTGTDTDGGAPDLYQRSGGVTTLVSVEGVGASGPTNLTSFPAGLSADGSRVLFSTQQNMVAADTDGFQDIYERFGGTTTLVSDKGVASRRRRPA